MPTEKVVRHSVQPGRIKALINNVSARSLHIGPKRTVAWRMPVSLAACAVNSLQPFRVKHARHFALAFFHHFLVDRPAKHWLRVILRLA
jgi:hypothetical protein